MLQGEKVVERVLSSILFSQVTENPENSQAKEKKSFKEQMAEDILIIS